MVLLPDKSIWAEDGYLVCDRYALGGDEIDFLRWLVEETGCRLFERGVEVSVDDLTPKVFSDPRVRSDNATLIVGPFGSADGAIPGLKS